MLKEDRDGKMQLVERYEGEFCQDSRQGKGDLYMEDGDIYKGEFYEGEANGNSPNKHFQGEGHYIFSSGDFYEGDFIDGNLCGDGTYFSKNVNFLYKL